MKHLLPFFSVLCILFSCSIALAEKVVVIPLGSGNCSNDPSMNKIVFVSSIAYSGNLGGVDGANGICNQLAQDGGLTGSYKAWISTVDSSPATTFNRSKGPYVLVGQAVVASDWNDLTDSVLSHAIHITEKGTNLYGTAWTNTHPDGSAIIDSLTGTCNNFTSAAVSDQAVIGTIAQSYSSEWTRHVVQSCQALSHIYCIEQ